MKRNLGLAFVTAVWMLGAAQFAIAASFEKGTVVKTELAQPIATASLKPGDTIALRVVQPYPNNDTAWQGARITMHVTDVTHGSSGTRARVGFIFDGITLAGGASKPISAFVVSSAVVRRGGTSLQSSSIANAPQAQPPSSITGRSQTSSTVFWQHKVASKSTSTTPTGGYAYARTPGIDVTLPEGSIVTVELASPIDVP